jgi:hypothetical protein
MSDYLDTLNKIGPQNEKLENFTLVVEPYLLNNVAFVDELEEIHRGRYETYLKIRAQGLEVGKTYLVGINATYSTITGSIYNDTIKIVYNSIVQTLRVNIFDIQNQPNEKMNLFPFYHVPVNTLSTLPLFTHTVDGNDIKRLDFEILGNFNGDFSKLNTGDD